MKVAVSGRARATSSATAWWSGPDHDGQRRARAMGGGLQHMRQQRLARHRMQHLWQRGAHPRPLTGREHHRQAGSSSHRSPLLERFPAKWNPVRVKKTRQNKNLLAGELRRRRL
jgi:hypothetical protein